MQDTNEISTMIVMILLPTEAEHVAEDVPTGSAFSPLMIALKSGWARISAAVISSAAAPPT